MVAEILGLEGARALQPRPPAYLHIPDYVATTGREVGELCATANFEPDDQQQLALDAVFARTPDWELAVRHAVVVGPRQSTGKTGFFKQASLGWLYVDRIPLVVYSAHNALAYTEMVEGMEDLVLGCRALSRWTIGITQDQSGYVLETAWGGRMLFRTRTTGNGRSLSAPRIILDEGYAVTAAHTGALMPTIVAQPDPQILTGSSHPRMESDWLREIQDVGRAGTDPEMFYMEFKAPDPAVACDRGKRCDHDRRAEGCGCDKPEMIRLANPQYGGRAKPSTFVTLRNSMPAAEYAREIMGWRDEPGTAVKALDGEKWLAARDIDSRITGTVGIGAAVATDRTTAAIATAGRREDGLLHVEVVEYRTGAAWVIERTGQLAKDHAAVAAAVNPGADEKLPETELAAVGLHTDKKRQRTCPLIMTGVREYAGACAGVADDLEAERIVHIGQDQLTQAAVTTEKRPLGGAWAFGRGSGPDSADIVPLEAATLARHAFLAHESTMMPAPFVIVRGQRS